MSKNKARASLKHIFAVVVSAGMIQTSLTELVPHHDIDKEAYRMSQSWKLRSSEASSILLAIAALLSTSHDSHQSSPFHLQADLLQSFSFVFIRRPSPHSQSLLEQQSQHAFPLAAFQSGF